MKNHDFNRKLTPKERKEIASALGWMGIDGVGGNLIGIRPMYDGRGNIYAWMDEQHVPDYDTDILRFVRYHINLNKDIRE